MGTNLYIMSRTHSSAHDTGSWGQWRYGFLLSKEVMSAVANLQNKAKCLPYPGTLGTPSSEPILIIRSHLPPSGTPPRRFLFPKLCIFLGCWWTWENNFLSFTGTSHLSVKVWGVHLPYVKFRLCCVWRGIGVGGRDRTPSSLLLIAGVTCHPLMK